MDKEQNLEGVRGFSLGSFAVSWEQRKLGEICQVTMGQSPDGATYSDVPSDYILVQGNADLKNGWVFPRVWTTQKTKTAEVGDLIISVRAPACECQRKSEPSANQYLSHLCERILEPPTPKVTANT